MADVLSWDELQSIVGEYETVFVMAYLPDSPPSAKGLKVFDEFSRRMLDARFLTFDSTTPSGLKIVTKLQIKFAPMTFAYRNGVKTGECVGHTRPKILSVIESAATVPEDDDQLDQAMKPDAFYQQAWLAVEREREKQELLERPVLTW